MRAGQLLFARRGGHLLVLLALRSNPLCHRRCPGQQSGAAMNHPIIVTDQVNHLAYETKPGPNRGRGVAFGYYP